jgi:putative ABC transport system ATP-binding protein
MSARRSSTTPAPIVEAIDLYRFFHTGDDETLALRGVALRVYPGQIIAVTGPSGSGKSTLLSCIAGLDEPDGGTVRIDGETMSRRTEAERSALRARKVGMLFQSGNLFDHLSVEQNVQFAQRLVGPRHPKPIKSLLDEVGLGHRATATPTTLSGGEAARAGLAVALANRPVVVLADEPTGELDQISADRILELLRRRADRGAAILIVTHNPHVAALADREIHLLDGRISP